MNNRKAGPSLRSEMGIAALLLCVFLGMTAVSVLTRREYWPFCTYPMFRSIQAREEIDLYRLVGVERSGRRTILDREDDLGLILPSRTQSMCAKLAARRQDQEAGIRFLHSLGRASRYDQLELWLFRWRLDGDLPKHDRPTEQKLVVRSAR